VRHRAVAVIQAAGAQGYSDGDLDLDFAQPAEAIRSALSDVARQLTPDAKEWFLAETVRIGLADGQLTEQERQTAQAIAPGPGDDPSPGGRRGDDGRAGRAARLTGRAAGTKASRPAYERLFQEIAEAGCHFYAKVLNAPDHRVPQVRPRLPVAGSG
jgi:site-specific DNA-cytosine methylase